MRHDFGLQSAIPFSYAISICQSERPQARQWYQSAENRKANTSNS